MNSSQPTKSKVRIKVVQYSIFAVLCISFLVYAKYFSRGAKQRENLRIGSEYLKPLINDENQIIEFKNLKAFTYTANGGSILITGEVDNKGDLDFFKNSKFVKECPLSIKLVVQINESDDQHTELIKNPN